MYEPTWSQPLENFQQTGSFVEGVTPPAAAPDAGTLVQLPCVNEDWLPLILGALDQLRNPSSWLDSLTDPQRYDVLGMADRLRQMIAAGLNVPCCNVQLRLNNCVLQYSVDGGVLWADVAGWTAGFADCVKQAIIPTPPLLPPGSDNSTRACNIATYIATDVIHEAITQAINAYDTNLSLLALAGNVAAATFAFELPWTAAFIYGIYDLYSFFTAGNIADLRTSEADSVLWSDVTCAIYSAIKIDGQITAANCAAVIANICAITYAHPVAITAICAYVTQLGCDQLRALQVVGALAVGDCSACGGAWCHYWDFRLADPTIGPGAFWSFDAGSWRAGYGMQGANGSNTQLVFEANFPATNVRELQIHYSTEFVNGSAPRQIDFYLAGVHKGVVGLAGAASPQPAGRTEDFTSLFGVVDRIQVTIDSDYNLDTIFCNNLLLRGPASSPFGPDNCIP